MDLIIGALTLTVILGLFIGLFGGFVTIVIKISLIIMGVALFTCFVEYASNVISGIIKNMK